MCTFSLAVFRLDFVFLLPCFFKSTVFFFLTLQLWEVYKERRCIRTFIGKQFSLLDIKVLQ